MRWPGGVGQAGRLVAVRLLKQGVQRADGGVDARPGVAGLESLADVRDLRR